MKQNYSQYDLIVIGGGHAGVEASMAASKMGLETLLITLDSSKIGEMSCNPSIGGVGKGQLTKEIDALGGMMGINADYTGIQFKRLNTKKGSAVQSSRCQSDKKKYSARIQRELSVQNRLSILEAEVKRIILEGKQVRGVEVQLSDHSKQEIEARAVVLTTGTFMQGLMHCGFETQPGGRVGERSSIGLSDELSRLGLKLMRLKTGTPPRLLRESIDFNAMETQSGDDPPRRFSFWNSAIELPQVACYLAYTNREVHKVIAANLKFSPLFSGVIKGIGPRYCPSIEDKVVKFPEKDRHTVFFEPESLETDWIYPNGISTSLPAEVQVAFLQQIPGCKEVQFARYGYAVEYDCIQPTQLKATLETKDITGFYCAGQVNGTSGYEEAAAQGLMAGINASLKLLGRPPLILDRSEAYIGVMIDDLIHLGVTEPYRMFTSRAEFRLSLREDNADLRLSQYGYELGLLNSAQFEIYKERKANLEKFKVALQKTIIKPSPAVSEYLLKVKAGGIEGAMSLSQLLKRPEVGLDDLAAVTPQFSIEDVPSDIRETLQVEVKYEGYISIQKEEINRLQKLKGVVVPPDTDYFTVVGLSTEIKEKLSRHQPSTIAEASQISGVTPAALSALLAHISKSGRMVSRETTLH